ncbi:MAG: hypothetical protein ACJ8FV_21010 [Xanthobacteraceae bacterium]|jgi:hypothetical protein
MIKRFVLGAAIAALLLETAQAGPDYTFFASPSGGSNGQCTQALPCSPQGAVEACLIGSACTIVLQPGIYIDPAVNIYYHRTLYMTGDCGNPYAVVFRATRPNTPLVFVQDHATGRIGCLTMESTTTGTSGLFGRQHSIIDYFSIAFGSMRNGRHVALNEFSIASCGETIWLIAGATVHAGVWNLSKLNLACQINLTNPWIFEYFLVATDWSIVDAYDATFTGPGAGHSAGIRCFNYLAIVNRPLNGQSFPGNGADCQ